MYTLRTKHLLVALIMCWAFGLQAQWTIFAPMNAARWGNGVVGHNGLLYSVSGNGSTAHEVYNPVTNTWTTLASIPTANAYPGIAAWNGKVYVLGGAAGSTWLNTNQIYDIATNTWSAGAVIPTNCMGGAAVAYNGKIYLAGGWNNANLNILQIYDIATNTWTTGANAPTARNEGAAGLIGNTMYVFGGYVSAPVNTLEAYNITTNTWQARTGMNTARYIFAGASDGSLLHAAGGFPNTGTYETYDPGTNLWTTRPSLTQARYRVAGGVANSCFFVVGGFNGSITVATNEGTCGLVVLPVHPSLHLEARPRAAAVQLSWWLDTQASTHSWELQRSPDGLEFETIAQLGSETGFWDEKPLEGINYYRLLGHDGQGGLVQSELVAVDLTDLTRCRFDYATTRASLTFHPLGMGAGKATLRDLAGLELMAMEFDGAASAPALEWSLAELPAGVYVFVYQSASGVFQRKLMKVD